MRSFIEQVRRAGNYIVVDASHQENDGANAPYGTTIRQLLTFPFSEDTARMLVVGRPITIEAKVE